MNEPRIVVSQSQQVLGCPSFLTESPGDQIKREPEKLDDVKTYVGNLARWLVG